MVYYPFDVESGTVVDNQGTQGSGVLVGGGRYGTGKDATFGKAFYGNRTGANDGYIQTGLTGTQLGLGGGDGSEVYTAMAWVKWDGPSGNVDHMIFGQEDGPGNTAMLHHGIRDDSENNAHYGGWGNDIQDAGVVPVGEWTHLAFQFDGADKVVYLNGV
ncbi:LamG domain-containing protein, partial [Akkermansiaceae bacterium]|nr:LamG domain-containing protein [Akkermansiaceae bacterium]